MTLFKIVRIVKRVLDYLPLITILYFSFAYLYMISYFVPFDIAVKDYYSYTEILFPLAVPLVLLVLAVLVLFMNQALQVTLYSQVDLLTQTIVKKRSTTEVEAPKTKWQKRFHAIGTKSEKMFEFLRRLIVGLTSLGLLGIILWAIFKENQFPIILLIVIYSFIYTIYTLPKSELILLQPFRKVAMVLTILLIVFSVFSLRYWYSKGIIKNGATHVIRGNYKGKIFQSNKDSLLFIGTSDQFYLFYRKADSSSFIIERAALDSVSVKRIQYFDWVDYAVSGWRW